MLTSSGSSPDRHTSPARAQDQASVHVAHVYIHGAHAAHRSVDVIANGCCSNPRLPRQSTLGLKPRLKPESLSTARDHTPCPRRQHPTSNQCQYSNSWMGPVSGPGYRAIVCDTYVNTYAHIVHPRVGLAGSPANSGGVANLARASAIWAVWYKV